MDPRLDQDQPVLGILVLSALLQVAPDVDCLLDEAVDVLGNLRSATCMKLQIPFFLRRRTIF
jgi:hypothetical protein